MPAIDSGLKQNFLDLVEVQTGLKIRSQDWLSLAKNIMGRVKALELSSPRSYYQRLVAECSLLAKQRQEWRQFLELVTIGESYFFRDQDQFQVLKEQILPDLIERRRSAYAAGSIPCLTLSLWSAGCSTGEEPYSLAILLQELIPDLPEWEISVLGTDLNPAALDKARRGIYRDWSFRQTEPRLKPSYFRPVASGWQIHDSIQRRVTFRDGNLLTDQFPNPGLNDVDLIVCRNVFIYFDAHTIARILAKFNGALSPDGYLVTGHAELYAQNLQQFEVQSFAGSVAYQRQSATVGKTLSPPRVLRSQAPRLSTNASTAATPQPSRLQRVPSVKAVAPNLQSTTQQKTQVSTQFLLAQSHWQRQELAPAMQYCDAALQLDGEALEPLYLKAQLARACCDRKLAKTTLKKILYLSPIFIPAYLELGAIYALETQMLRATKMYRTAQDLLNKLPPETVINYQGQITVKDLSVQLNQQLLSAA